MEHSRQWQIPELNTANGRRNKMFGSCNYITIYVVPPVIYSVSDNYFPSHGCRRVQLSLRCVTGKSPDNECNSDTSEFTSTSISIVLLLMFQVEVFGVVKLFNVVVIHQRFGDPCCLHLQGKVCLHLHF